MMELEKNKYLNELNDLRQKFNTAILDRTGKTI
jgi:hypothetical protein